MNKKVAFYILEVLKKQLENFSNISNIATEFSNIYNFHKLFKDISYYKPSE